MKQGRATITALDTFSCPDICHVSSKCLKSVYEMRSTQGFHFKVFSREIIKIGSNGEQPCPHMTQRLDLICIVTLKSKVRSTAVKIYEPSAINCKLQWLSDITAKSTFASSFGPSV